MWVAFGRLSQIGFDLFVRRRKILLSQPPDQIRVGGTRRASDHRVTIFHCFLVLSVLQEKFSSEKEQSKVIRRQSNSLIEKYPRFSYAPFLNHFFCLKLEQRRIRMILLRKRSVL